MADAAVQAQPLHSLAQHHKIITNTSTQYTHLFYHYFLNVSICSNFGYLHDIIHIF